MGDDAPVEVLDEQLCIGDEVSIAFGQLEEATFLEADGLLEDEVVLSSPPESHFATVFQLCYRTRVNAADELIAFEKQYAHKLATLDQDNKELHATLKRVKQKEEDMNKRSFAESIGNGLYFGQVVQLRHKRSGKWLCAADQQVAALEQENFRVYLSADASALSWFTLTPAAAYQAVGGPIIDMADVNFSPSETKGASFLHISTNPIVPVGMKKTRRMQSTVQEQKELNCSLQPSTFKFFRSCKYQENEDIIRAGDLVSFVDPQTNGTMRLLTEHIKERLGEGVPKCGVLQPNLDASDTSDSLWVIEHMALERGSTFEVSEYCCLRHVNTGEYLTVSAVPSDELEVTDVTTPHASAAADTIVRGVKHSRGYGAKDMNHEKDGSQFLLSPPFDTQGDYLCHNMLVLFKQKGRHYIFQQPQPDDFGLYSLHHTLDSEKGLPFILKRADSDFAIDVFFGKQACQLLHIIRDQMRAQKSASPPDFTFFAADEEGGDMQLIRFLFRKLLCFLIDDPSQASVWNVRADVQHQQLLREQGVTDALLDILEIAYILMEKHDDASNAYTIDEAQRTHILETTRHAFTFIRVSMVGNPGNQLYVSDRFHVLLKYAGNNTLANECISLLLDNSTIQEQKIGSSEIQEFILMLQSRAFNSSVLDMLKNVCSCHGSAMENNQTEVGETLLNNEDARGALVGLQESESGELMLKFPGSSKFETLHMVSKDSQSGDDGKVARSKFLVSQLYLFAEMCYDRNYIAIALLRKVVRFSSLCAAISDGTLSDEIRSAMVRLATCMYVDCEPQQSQRTKNLSFRWSDLVEQNKSVNPALSMKVKKKVKNETDKNFKLLKNTIHTNLTELGGEESFTEFTEHMVGLLLKLVDFKFYHANPKELQDVIDIILQLLTSETTKDSKASKTVRRGPSFRKIGQQVEGLNRLSKINHKKKAYPGQSIVYCLTHLRDPKHKKRVLQFIDKPVIMLSIIALVFVAILLPLGFPDVEDTQCQAPAIGQGWTTDCEYRSVFEGYFYDSGCYKADDDFEGDLNNCKKAIQTQCLFLGDPDATNWVDCEVEDIMITLQGMVIFDLVTYVIFAIELVTRFWAMNSTCAFFSNPFCLIDFTCVSLDTIVIALPSVLGPVGKNTKVLRALRLAKLVRLFKVARLLKALRDAMNQKDEFPPWTLAHNFKHPDRTKMQGMLEMVKVLLRAQEIDTRGKLISLVKECQRQHSLSEESKTSKHGLAHDIIDRIQEHLEDTDLDGARLSIMAEVKKLNHMAATGEEGFQFNSEPFADDQVATAVAKSASVKLESSSVKTPFNETLLRLIMYESPEVNQEALELLMQLCTADEMLLLHLQDVQLLANPADEMMYEHLMSELDFISSTLDSYELFSGLATDEDRKKSARVKTALAGLERYCLFYEDSLVRYATGGKGCKPNVEVQTMLRHLDAFGAALTWRDSVSVYEGDYDLDDEDSRREYENSVEIRRLINDFLVAFIFGNEELQVAAFPHLDCFIEDLRCQEINSALVIAETLRDNERLIRLAPADLIPSVMNLLERGTKRRDPNLAEVLYVMVQSGGRDRPIRENQVAIMQLLTRSPMATEMLFVCSDADGEHWKLRQKLMNEQMDGQKGPMALEDVHTPASEKRHGPPSAIPSIASPTQAVPYSSGRVAVPVVPSMDAPDPAPGTAAARFQRGHIDAPAMPTMSLPGSTDAANGQEGSAEGPPPAVTTPNKRAAGEEDAGVEVCHKPSIADEYSHLPRDLQYHVIMLRTLAHCGAGGINIVEANIQSVYKVNEMLHDLLKPGFIPEVRTAIGILYYDIVMDVQVVVPGMSHNKQWWMCMKTFPNHIDRMITALMALAEEGDTTLNPRLADGGLEMRHLSSFVFEYIIPCIGTFFQVYFQLLHEDDFELPICRRLYDSIVELYLLPVQYPRTARFLSDERRVELYTCAMAILGPCATDFNPPVQPPPTSEGIRKASLLEGGGEGEKPLALRESFKNKADALANSKTSKAFASEGSKALVKLLTDLPRVGNVRLQADLRFEPTLDKLVRHTRSLIQTLDDRKILQPEHEPSTIWLLKLFRSMIETAWGFEVEMRDDDEVDGEAADGRVAAIQQGLNSSGATTLCLDLIARGLSNDLKREAIKLLLALLFQEGGNADVQQTIHDHIADPASSLLLEEIRASVEFIEYSHSDVERARVDRNKADGVDDGEDGYEHEVDPLHEQQNEEGKLLLRALQLMCEGHFLPNQDILRAQMAYKYSVNLIHTVTNTFNQIGRHCSAFALDTAQALADLILEAIQGPCEGNQLFLANDTELIENMNRMLRLEPEDLAADVDEEDLEELKVTMLQILCALLEGQVPDPSNANTNMVYERVLSAVHVEFLMMIVSPPTAEVDADDPEAVEQMMKAAEDAEEAEMEATQVQSLVLLQMLRSYSELHKLPFDTKKLEAVGDEVISIEIIWNGVTQTRFFKVPEVCKHLAKVTRDKLVRDVDRSNMDSKLEDFVDRSQQVMIELDWQHMLKEMGLQTVFSSKNQNTSTWVTFWINIIINTLYLFFAVKGVPLDAEGLPTAWPGDNDGIPVSSASLASYHFNTGLAWLSGENSTLEYEDSAHGGLTRACYAFDEKTREDYWAQAEYTPSGEACGQACFRECFQSRENMYYKPGISIPLVIGLMNIAQCIMASFTLCLFLIVRMPITALMSYKTNESYFTAVCDVCMSLTSYYVMYVVFAILGAMPQSAGGSPMFNAVLLYDVLVKIPTCMDVCYAVIYPIKQLMATLILLLFVVYCFAFITFQFEYENFKNSITMNKGSDVCETLWRCFAMSVASGLRAGGGLGEYMTGISQPQIADQADMSTRYLLDFAFYVFVIIILMNIVFGIIIDTFSELREEKNEKLDDTTGRCFICGIDKNVFDSKGGAVYPKHIESEHNMWAYLKFMILIWKQDRDDDDGLEQFVRHCLENNDLDWFPAGKALCLDEDHEDEEKQALTDIATLHEKMRVGLERIRELNEEKSKELQDQVAMMRRRVLIKNSAGLLGSGRRSFSGRRMSAVGSPKAKAGASSRSTSPDQ